MLARAESLSAMLNSNTPLAARLRQRIAETGPVSVADYMAACLGDESHGYYRTRDPLGLRGDFITAPEISQVFGELIGLWCLLAWRGMDRPSPFHLAELGPGRGTLMADAMRAAAIDQDFIAASRIELVETSPVLRKSQQTLLAAHAPRWRERLEDAPDGPLIVVANEFLDALPVRQLVRRDGSWRERCVALDGDALAFCLGGDALREPATMPADAADAAGEGDIVELRPQAEEVIAELGRRAGLNPVAALFIDYGHARSAPGDTLQALAEHGYADPLDAPGEQDLTAHVDFAALARAAEDAGLAADGPIGQGEFLMKLGLAQRCESLMRKASAPQREAIESGARRLADPERMGALFKALCIRGRDVPTPPPFGE